MFKRNANGVWTDIEDVKRNQGGSWVDCESVKKNASGVWTPVWEKKPLISRVLFKKGTASINMNDENVASIMIFANNYNHFMLELPIVGGTHVVSLNFKIVMSSYCNIIGLAGRIANSELSKASPGYPSDIEGLGEGTKSYSVSGGDSSKTACLYFVITKNVSSTEHEGAIMIHFEISNLSIDGRKVKFSPEIIHDFSNVFT